MQGVKNAKCVKERYGSSADGESTQLRDRVCERVFFTHADSQKCPDICANTFDNTTRQCVRSRNNHLTAHGAVKQTKQLRVHVEKSCDVPSSLNVRCDDARSGGCRSPGHSSPSGMTCVCVWGEL